MAFDLATMVHALDVLEHDYLGTNTIWSPHNKEQETFWFWSDYLRSSVQRMPGLIAKSSTDYTVLNEFLKTNGQQPKFSQFDGVGVVSLLDMLVKWLVKAHAVDAKRYDPGLRDFVTYPAFVLQPQAVDVYHVEGLSSPLLCIDTKSGDKLWLCAAEQPKSGLDLLKQCIALTGSHTEHDIRYIGAQVPMVDLKTEPDISWMLGYDTYSERDGYHRIGQAFQSVHVRMNEKGARGTATTGLATDRSPDPKPKPYVLNRPFIGFFTRSGFDKLPLAMFYADFDVWTAPADLD